jgi:hypothetical protein
MKTPNVTSLVLALLFSILSVFNPVRAQSEESMLSEVVEIYDRINSFVDKIQTNPNKYKVMDSIRDVSTTAIERLSILKLSSNAEMAKVSRYFAMNFQYYFGIGYADIGQLATSRKYLSEIKEDMDYFDESKFPMRYTKGGTNYVIAFSNFRSTRCDYFVSYAELLYLNVDYQQSLTYVRKAIPLLDNGSWLSYVCYYYGISSKVSTSAFDSECVEFCSKQLSAYYNLSKAELDTIAVHEYDTYRMATQNLDKSIERGALSVQSYPHLVAAIQILKYYLDPYIEKDESQRKKNKFILLRWYNEAVMSPHSDKAFIKTAFNFATVYADPNSNDKTAWLQRYEKFDLQCSDYQWLIDEYTKLGDSINASRLAPFLTTCQEVEKKQAAALEAKQKKEAKKNNNSYNSSTGMPLIYAGINLFPLLIKPRDFGLALNIGGKNMVTEFSYLKVNSKSENYFDLDLKNVNDVPQHYWSGSYSHVNFKFPSDDWNNGRARPYVGLVLSYNERTFDPFPVNITSITTGLLESKISAPTSKQYAGLINFGFMGVNGFGIDFFMGMGAAYNNFDAHLTEYENEEYIIDDALVANRPSTYWSFIMRMGISVGIGYAKE